VSAALVVVLLVAACAGSQRIGVERNSRLKAEVLARLRADPATNPFDLGVEVVDGVATVTGTVPAPADREAALRIARAVAGLADVVDAIAVVPPTPTPPPVDDATLTARVRAKLAADPELHSFAIDVATVAGEVTLSGQVADDGARAEAERLTRATPGVRAVRNLLRVGAG
jgi:hyperosmotically inducible periplasmic protein